MWITIDDGTKNARNFTSFFAFNVSQFMRCSNVLSKRQRTHSPELLTSSNALKDGAQLILPINLIQGMIRTVSLHGDELHLLDHESRPSVGAVLQHTHRQTHRLSGISHLNLQVPR